MGDEWTDGWMSGWILGWRVGVFWPRGGALIFSSYFGSGTASTVQPKKL